MIEDDVAVVIERELVLLTPQVRSSADELEELLDLDFEEIGKSGRLWTRGELIAALVTDTDPEKHSINFSDMSGRTVGPGWGPMTPPSRTAGTKQRSSVGVSDQVPTLGSDYRLGHGYCRAGGT